jgi:probable rRNA maturation factor
VEISVLLCGDETISELNETYRDTRGPTDVLSFGQTPVELPGAPRLLGDIVISLETVGRACGGEKADMRSELHLLFCHGLLHLLGYDHQTAGDRDRMAAKQAEYLRVPFKNAWHWAAKAHPR